MAKIPTILRCIAGTDTDIGKTVVTAGLLRALSGLGLPVRGVKAVQTGCLCSPTGGMVAPDLLAYRDAAPEVPCTALHTLRLPCSPHLAAEQEGRTLDAAELARSLRDNACKAGVTLVEGAGGLLVPLNRHATLLDVFALLGAPVLLVVANRLGAINHALLSIEAVRSRGLRLEGIILTHPSPISEDPVERLILADTGETLARMGGVPVLASLAHQSGLASPERDVRAAAWTALAGKLGPLAECIASGGNA